jgi:hypothetical protein
MRGSNVAALLAGFGTGYLNTKSKEADRKREDEKDRQERERHDQQMEINRRQLERLQQEDARDQQVAEGLEEAQQMRVGEGLRDSTGAAVDVSEEAMRQRLVDSGADEEVAAQTAPIYAQKAGEKGSEEWLSGGFDMGKVRPTSKADIIRAQGVALSKGGTKNMTQAMQMQEKADQLDMEALQAKILAANSIEEIDKEYDIVPDGFRVKSTTADGGRFTYWYEDEQGNRVAPKVGPKDFADFNEFKQFAAAYVKQNPEYITSVWDGARKRSSEAEEKEYKRGRDAKSDEFNERDFNLRKTGQEQNTAIAREGLSIRKKELEKGGEAPADVRTAQWLISQGVAKSTEEAWQMVKTTKSSSPEEAIQSITVKLMKDNPDFQDSPEAAVEVARKVYRSISNPEPAAPPKNRPPLSTFNR